MSHWELCTGCLCFALALPVKLEWKIQPWAAFAIFSPRLSSAHGNWLKDVEGSSQATITIAQGFQPGFSMVFLAFCPSVPLQLSWHKTPRNAEFVGGCDIAWASILNWSLGFLSGCSWSCWDLGDADAQRWWAERNPAKTQDQWVIEPCRTRGRVPMHGLSWSCVFSKFEPWTVALLMGPLQHSWTMQNQFHSIHLRTLVHLQLHTCYHVISFQYISIYSYSHYHQHRIMWLYMCVCTCVYWKCQGPRFIGRAPSLAGHRVQSRWGPTGAIPHISEAILIKKGTILQRLVPSESCHFVKGLFLVGRSIL